MEQFDIIQRIDEVEREIASLPPGNIAAKKVRGKEYYYHRVTHNKKRTETYVNFEQIEEFRAQIEKRKALEAELKELKNLVPISGTRKNKQRAHEFSTYVRIGEQLKNLASPVKKYKRRECYSVLHDFVFGEQQDKVCILYGLRRTGKTTLIRQILLNMTPDELQRAAYIQIKAKDTLSEINSDLKYMEQQGYLYVFIDEVTLMEEFIEGAALFSDIYASSGMKIVLSGTDSLGFIFTEYEQLYDRCILLHTTFIPYREFETVLGIKGVDEYIRYGGTMSMGGVNYNEKSSFATKKSADEYIDSAIARNIQHSLKYYQEGGHFRHLYELYEKGELTSAINRVVENINHRFTKEILTRTFESGDLSISARDLLHFPNVNRREKITIVSQPGMRYAQADALVNSLLLDEKFNELSVVERHWILERILGEIKGRMMEDIVLLETKLANPHKEVFQLQFAVGEFDMVIYNPDTLSCEIFEVKYSKEVVPNQYRHLINKEKCAETEHRFGTIIGKYVIYRGETTESKGIQYLNVEEYLKSINRKLL